eukprot:TRINITY_DN42680_c0_g1_i1.p2 TRINITY_DN42680_c0_g1~~TRINITY_DN42680_c0_g1_i1.p2  ORF type:complete len:205 (+),score=16.66 TRINITY_DN42680_c0_g1_i1:116-730(+)
MPEDEKAASPPGGEAGTAAVTTLGRCPGVMEPEGADNVPVAGVEMLSEPPTPSPDEDARPVRGANSCPMFMTHPSPPEAMPRVLRSLIHRGVNETTSARGVSGSRLRRRMSLRHSPSSRALRSAVAVVSAEGPRFKAGGGCTVVVDSPTRGGEACCGDPDAEAGPDPVPELGGRSPRDGLTFTNRVESPFHVSHAEETPDVGWG